MPQLKKQYTAKDFDTDQPSRWCPGCGDTAILASVKNVLANSGKNKEDIAFISGIGCSSRFPYYVDTYGMHSIHGRAVAIASGLKLHNPGISVWVITGDGDGLAIGGNHFIHALRRNMDLNILIFNNEIYGLTKGQYSPTTKMGQKTATSPYGTIEEPFVPSRLALGAGATFFARSSASDLKHLQKTLTRAEAHKGTSVVEIYQNCVIFNDQAFDEFLGREHRDDNTIKLEHGERLIFGKNEKKVVVNQKGTFQIVDEESADPSEVVIHDEKDINLAFMLAQMEEVKPLGVFYATERPGYAEQMHHQIEAAKNGEGKISMQDLLHTGETWTVD